MKNKSKDYVKVCLPRRSTRKLSSQLTIVNNNCRSYKKCNRKTKINFGILPNEILCKIFSYLNVQKLFFDIRLVCKRWSQVSMSPELWTKICVKNNIPTQILCKWIESSNLLKEIFMENRNDANIITELVRPF